MLRQLRQHPDNICAANARYQQQLCSGVCVQDPAAVQAPASPPDAAAANLTVAQSAVTVASDAAAVTAATDAGADSPPAAGVTAAGVEFIPTLEMFAHYIGQPVGAAVATTEQEAAAAAKVVAMAKAEAAATVSKAAAQTSAAEAAAAEAAAAVAAAAAAAADAKASKGVKDAKGKPAAAAAKAKEASSAADKGGKGGKKAAADKAAADAAAASAEQPIPAVQFEYPGVKVPVDRQGAALCLEDGLPEAAIKRVLQTLQVQFLQDMVTFCEEAKSNGHSWAGDEEVAATEELEARLRSHRWG